MSSSHDVQSMLHTLTMTDMANALPVAFSRNQKHSRAKMEDAVFLLPEEDQITLEDAARAKKQKLETNIIPSTEIPPPVQTPVNPSVSPETQQARIAKFIDATGQKATKMSNCAVCAGSSPISPQSPALNSTQASALGTTRHRLFGESNYGRGYDSEAGCMGESLKKHDRPTRLAE